DFNSVSQTWSRRCAIWKSASPFDPLAVRGVAAWRGTFRCFIGPFRSHNGPLGCMKHLLRKILSVPLAWCGLACLRQKHFLEMHRLNAVLLALANLPELSRGEATSDAETEGIIFSKDRACQLHALLESFFLNANPAVRLHVLFTASSPEHRRAYEEERMIFRNHPVAWVTETEFRDDLITLLGQLRAGRVMFLVDDIIV